MQEVPGSNPGTDPHNAHFYPRPVIVACGLQSTSTVFVHTTPVESNPTEAKFGTLEQLMDSAWLFLSTNTYFCNISYLGTYTQHITHQSADFHNHLTTTNTNNHFAPHHHRTQPKTKDSLIIFIINIIMMPLPLSGS